MPVPLPPGWPAPSPVETTPEVRLTVGDGSLVQDEVTGDWSSTRELVSTMLAGNVRFTSGMAVGSASATLKQRSPQVAPWNVTIPDGVPCSFYATRDGGASRVPLGDFQTDATTGGLAASNPSWQIAMIERQFDAKVIDQRVPASYDQTPRWLLEALAMQAGFQPEPPAVGELLAAQLPSIAGPGVWMGGGSVAGFNNHQGYALESELFVPGATYYLTFTLRDGTVADFGFVNNVLSPFGGGFNVAGNPLEIIVDVAAGTFTITVNGDNGNFTGGDTLTATGSFTPGLDPNWPTRVQVQFTMSWDDTGQQLSCSGAARSSNDADWSPTIDTGSVFYANAYSSEHGSGSQSPWPQSLIVSGPVYGLDLGSGTDASQWAKSNVDIQLSGGNLPAPYFPASTKVWAAIQQLCSAWLACAFVDANGTLCVRDRDWLAGVGRTGTPLDVGVYAEDLQWTLDPNDQADRVEVTYKAVGSRNSGSGVGTELWSYDKVISIPPGGSVGPITVELDYLVVPNQSGNFNLYNPNVPASVPPLEAYFEVQAATTPNGVNPVTDYSVTVSRSSLMTLGRFDIYVLNSGTSTVWLVDSNGQPGLSFHSGYAFTTSGIASAFVFGFGNNIVLERGAGAEDAVKPLTVDLGSLVQTDADAEAIADFIWARVQNPLWKASSVRVVPDWSRDVGDVVQLQHPRTGLNQKAIITKIAWSGTAGSVQQLLDLVLLPG